MSQYLVISHDDEEGKLIGYHEIINGLSLGISGLRFTIQEEKPTRQGVPQVQWDRSDHEHIKGFHEHEHPHGLTVHSNMDGLVGKGENTGNTFVHVQGTEPAIVGEPPEDS